MEEKFFSTSLRDLFGIFYADDEFWLVTCQNPKIYRWTLGANNEEIVFGIEGYGDTGKRGVNQILEVNGGIYALPGYADAILKCDREHRTFKKTVNYPERWKFEDYDAIKFSNYLVDQGKIIAFPFNSKEMLIYDTTCGMTRRFSSEWEVCFDKEPYTSILCEKKWMITEGELGISFCDFVESIHQA